MSVGAPPDLFIYPLNQIGPEAAVHALAPATGGWRAVGSLTPPLQSGTAVLWSVADDGTVGEPEALPTGGSATTSVARDLVTIGTTTVVAGYQGAGMEALPVVWRDGGDGAWTHSVLATRAGSVGGAIVDEVMALVDGTFVVVGRGSGPFPSELLLWWSSDDGLTWQSFTMTGERSFLPPLVATNGSRIAMLLRTTPGRDGMAVYHSATIDWDDAGPRMTSYQKIDPTPDERSWPRALLWDGAAFVGSFDTDGSPIFATSADGVAYTAEPMEPPGLDSSLPSAVKGAVLVDGAIVVFIDQGKEILAFRREGAALVPVELPYVVTGRMGYLEGRELFATDGHRIGYLAVNWATKVFLGWDGVAWTSRPISEVPAHRNPERYEVRDIETTGSSRLAKLAWAELDAPGHYAPSSGGILGNHRGLSTGGCSTSKSAFPPQRQSQRGG